MQSGTDGALVRRVRGTDPLLDCAPGRKLAGPEGSRPSRGLQRGLQRGPGRDRDRSHQDQTPAPIATGHSRCRRRPRTPTRPPPSRSIAASRPGQRGTSPGPTTPRHDPDGPTRYSSTGPTAGSQTRSRGSRGLGVGGCPSEGHRRRSACTPGVVSCSLGRIAAVRPRPGTAASGRRRRARKTRTGRGGSVTPRSPAGLPLHDPQPRSGSSVRLPRAAGLVPDCLIVTDRLTTRYGPAARNWPAESHQGADRPGRARPPGLLGAGSAGPWRGSPGWPARRPSDAGRSSRSTPRGRGRAAAAR